ncbi:MAG: alpha/beta fold hydrolase [Bacteroidetes bacterium]|nr:MAG: alpha/beta fold hydrolase [Bacteroidota bacterium]
MELNYQQEGSGHPLIILHGLFGMLDNWVSISRKLAEKYSVYIIDQRNHGRSPRHNVFNYPAMVDDLLEFMEGYDIKSAYLLGHSMGGKTAMQFSFDYPEKVDKLIVADISPEEYDHRHDTLIEAMMSVDLSKYESRAEVDADLKEKIKSSRIRQFLLKNLYWKDRSSLGWKTNLEVILDNLQEIFKELKPDDSFKKPVLFIRGSESPYITDLHIPRIKELFPNSEIETIDDASHWLHAEKPREFIKITENFLQ